MPAQRQSVLATLRSHLPTVLTLGILGSVAWWGYAWDWKAPRLATLLGKHDTHDAEEDKKPEENEEEESNSANKPLHPVKLASEEALRTAGIKVEPVELRPVGEYVTANGEIDYDQNRYAHLSSRASGTAWSVHKHAGDEVKKGDVLALIACPELARVKFDFQQAMLQVQTRERLLQRMKSAGTSTPLQQIDSAESSLREARIRLFGDQQSLQNLGLMIRTEDLNKLTDEQIAARLRTLGIPDSLLQSLDTTTLTNNLLPMYAPFDGMVVKRDIVIGEIVNTTTPQFILADLRRLWIMLNVRLEDVGKVALDQEVTFRIDGTEEYTPLARVSWVSAEMDEKTRTVSVRAEVPNPFGRLRPHSFGHGRILIAKHQRLLVPTAALQWDGQSYLVFVQSDLKSSLEFQPVRVQRGSRQGEFTEVLAGVRAGQAVATAGSHALLSEMRKDLIRGED